MKCEKSGNHTVSYQSLLLSTTVLNDTEESILLQSVQRRSVKYSYLCTLDITLTLIIPTSYKTDTVSGSHGKSIIEVKGLERMDNMQKGLLVVLAFQCDNRYCIITLHYAFIQGILK